MVRENGRFSISPEQDKTRFRTFTYKTCTTWTEGRSGVLTSEGKASLRFSAPPEFKGEPGLWTPEHMFVACVEMCHMATFIAFASKRDLPVVSYRSHANGVLEYVDGDYRFTRIVIFPTIVVSSSSAGDELQAILRDAEKHCLVTNSIASIVEVNPTIIVQ
ncbi:MAG: putative Peroxiredoxin OsmC [Bacteroidetes bacterium]|nr:putative Peroxiredoxin OsmC [Bacteroidota bacterium]